MKKLNTVFLTLIILFNFSISGTGETGSFKKFQIIPKEDSAADKEFALFISKFKKDIKEKNIKSLKKSIAPDVAFNIEEYGIEGFLKIWKLDKDAKNSEFWNEMKKILSMGSAYYNEEKTSYAYPYLFVAFPENYDSYEYAAATGKKVNVRKAPSSKSPVVETLDYEIVKTVNAEPYPKKEKIDGFNGIWIQVITSSGKKGYIFSRYIHSPIGHRAIFEKRDNVWLMTAFVSGD